MIISDHQKEKTLGRLLYILLMLVLISTTVFTLITYKHRFQSDAATTAMIAYEQIDTHSLFLDDWVYSQDFWPFFIFNPVVLLLSLVNNSYLATQLSVLIQTSVIFALSLLVLNKLKKDMMNLLILSFVFSGISIYWSEFFWGQGQYGNVIMWILLCMFFIFSYMEPNGKFYYVHYILLFIINLYINSTGVRYIPLFSGISLIALSLMLFLPEFKCVKKKNILLIINIFISTGVGTFIFLLLRSKYLFSDGINASNLSSYYQVWTKNITTLMEGFFTLICDANPGANLASLSGVIFTYRLLISLALIVLTILLNLAFIKTIIHIDKFASVFIVIFSILINIVSIYSLLFTNISINSIAAARYLMTGIFISYLTLPVVLFEKEIRIQPKIFITLLFVPIILFNCYSLNRKLNVGLSEKEIIGQYLEDNNLEYGYASYWMADSITVLSNFSVKIYHINLDSISPDAFMNRNEQYKRFNNKGNFLLLTNDEYSKLDKNYLYMNIGNPIKELTINGYIILVYDKSFYNYLPNWK